MLIHSNVNVLVIAHMNNELTRFLYCQRILSAENSYSSEDGTGDSLIRRVETPPSRVAMLPRLEVINPSDATHPWQTPPSYKF